MFTSADSQKSGNFNKNWNDGHPEAATYKSSTKIQSLLDLSWVIQKNFIISVEIISLQITQF